MKYKLPLLYKVLNTSIEQRGTLKILYNHAENLFKIKFYELSSRAPMRREKNIEKQTFIKEVLLHLKNNKLPENLKKENVVIDFSSPNIAKPFHMGHLRSTLIGSFIANINKYYQNNVIKLNYLGDWGTQFGLLQYGLETKNIDLKDLSHDPIKDFYNIYVDMNALSSEDENIRKTASKYFTDIELGSCDLGKWKQIREITVNYLKSMYERLGIQFDEYHWESDYNRRQINSLIQMLEKDKILIEDTLGKRVVKVKDQYVPLLKSDNSTLYLTRDIAALLDRYDKFNFNRMLYVVDNAQANHFIALFDIIGRINSECASKCEHIKFGRITGLSTRKGNAILLTDILDVAKEKLYEMQKNSKNTRQSAVNEETWDILGKSAVFINDLKRNRCTEYTFEWNKVLNTDGESGIKLQYLHCRLHSLEKKSGILIPEHCDPDCLTEEVIGTLVALLGEYENVLYASYTKNEAAVLIDYLFKLARCVNRMYKELPIKGVNIDVGSQRLLVFHIVRNVLKTSLEILGLKPLDEM